MEQTIDIKNIYDVMNCINMVVINAKNPKSISSPKYQKAQDIVSEVKNSWKKYMEAVVLESILSKITFKDSLSENGQKIYNELKQIANKKNTYLENFKRLITKQKLGLFEEKNVVSTYFVRYEINLDNEKEYVLHESKDRKNLTSINNSLSNQGIGLLSIFEKLERQREFSKESPLEIEAKLNEFVEKSKDLDYTSLSSVMKNELGMKLDVTKLDALKLEQGRVIRQMQSLNNVTSLLEKYRSYISSETYLKIAALSNDFAFLKSSLTARENEITKSFDDEINSISEKLFGSEKANRITALLAMLTRGHDGEGKELTTEKKAILTEELEKMQKENPELYKITTSKYLAEENVKRQALEHVYSEQSKNKLDDSLLSSKEKSERAYYYELLVVNKDLDKFISMSNFSDLYDKYLKLEQNDSLLLSQIVHYYLAYLDYLDKVKERNQEPEFINWEKYVDNMLIQNGYIKKEGR